jgi:hypothetical protein
VGFKFGMVALPQTTLYAVTDTADGHAARKLKVTVFLASFLVRQDKIKKSISWTGDRGFTQQGVVGVQVRRPD